MMSRLMWTKSLSRMCSMLASVPVSRLSTQMTRWPRRRSSSHRCEPRKPAPPVTRLVGMARSLAQPAQGGCPHDVGLAPPQGDLLGVEVLEQGLGELARGAELVPQAGQGHRPVAARGQREDPALSLGQRVAVVVERLGDPDGDPSAAQGGEVAGVE